ncbi:uncharacterized protein LOC108608451 isoform X1 [Drosophila busckii]|uniref:uncharacterized protein LOC108608451 isoform X1 n=1 Tax=Drosophila busckii TaxID=30019 RepID=UPI001432E1E4|nr:uncharacterized protein LOC108608451 isoform X1 [Drosophila busckii]
MFSLLSSSQIYGLPQTTTNPITSTDDNSSGQNKSNSLPHNKSHKQQQQQQQQQHRRSTSSLSDTAGGKFFANLSAKSPSQFIERFIKSELLSGYDTLKCQNGGVSSSKSPSCGDKDKPSADSSSPLYSNLQTDWGSFSCLQGSYRSHGDSEFYEAVQVKSNTSSNSNDTNMRSKTVTEAATLQHYQKLPEPTLETNFNTQAAGHTPAYKKLGFAARLQKQSAEHHSDNSQSSRNARSSRSSSSSEVQRSSSGSSSTGAPAATTAATTPERLQRRRLLQMISNYDQQNKQLHRDLAKEKRRRTEELACVVKSLLCFESKLKNDMKTVNQRLLERDAEICRLLRQNRALRKRAMDQQRDEGMVADQETTAADDEQRLDECLVLEALQCNNCRKQFYDIELRASATQTCGKELGVSAKAEHGSSSDDTVSSSFYGARRSVRYTSKRTAGTFRDYMRSRAMHIDDAALEQQSEENTSSISREDSQTSYEQLHNYSRAMERMHGVKATLQDGDYSEHSSLELEQQQRRRNSSASSRSSSNKTASSVAAQLEEDDGIFSPTQDDEDFDELDPEQEQQLMAQGAIKIVQRRCADFSEASPKQIYETTTDDWYASASDQEELSTVPVSVKPYGQGAVNPVLECVNQILLQQSMEETMREHANSSSPNTSITPTPKSALALKSQSSSSLPRRSSLSGRSGSNARKRVHFSTKNSMVHVPRHDDEEAHSEQLISHYHPMAAAEAANVAIAVSGDLLNYESIYSNEYEPIGSERASNLYVDMAAAAIGAGSDANSKTLHKLPPALPPKPANLLKFRKSLQQLEEQLNEDEGDCAVSTTTTSEPDYCSIAEVGGTSVQIVADVHKAPESSTPTEQEHAAESQDDDDDDACSAAASHKTEEIEEIFADIPKLPNVAAIIAPKQSADYMLMAPKTLRLQLPSNTHSMPSQYKRKHVPNILAEINKRMSLPSSPTTPTTPKSLPSTPNSNSISKSLLQLSDALPLQAEFDWYNLDAEFDKGSQEPGKSSQGDCMLAEISEGNECLVTAADEYNLDEEFQQEDEHDQELGASTEPVKIKQMQKNLASFEKFIEGSGLSTKPLPSKRKIYFDAPFV